MRVLVANNYHYLRGGSEKVMFEEMAILEQAGHEVRAFSARHPSNLPAPLDPLFPEVAEFGALSLAGRALHYPRMIANPAVKQAFARAIDAFRPDLVHCHNVYGRLTPVVVEAARERGIPVVLTAHDYKLICPAYLRLDRGRPCSACAYGHYGPSLVRACHKGSRLYSVLYGIESAVNAARGRYDGVAAFICPSRFLLDSLAEKGIPRARLRYLPNFLGGEPAPAGDGAGGYVFYAGRLSHEKGVACLLRAMEKVPGELRIAGDGPERAALEREAEARGIASRVRFLGHCDRQALTEQILGSAVCVVPSEWYENAPMAVLEAFAMGKPVVGAAIGGIPELVVPGTTGLLFPPGDAGRLAEALVDLLSNRDRSGAMGENGRRMVAERFSPQSHLSGLLEIYRSVTA